MIHTRDWGEPGSAAGGDERLAALRDWLAGVRPDTSGPPESISGDASFRRYFRVRSANGTRVVMDAPPEHEATGPFIDIAERLRAAGVQAPRILAADRAQGFVLLSDLGDALYLDRLDAGSAPTLYAGAITTLVRMQTGVATAGLAGYDEPRLRSEMELFARWLLGEHLGLAEDAFRSELAPAFTALAESALEQPRVFVHRDYHSRNLMRIDDAEPGVLDFQDAVAGPLTYDLVSLLRDCYIAWPADRVDAWIGAYRDEASSAGIELPAAEIMRRWFDLMGVQRHLKAIGIFARLHHRDGKPRYLADIPRTWGYIEHLFGRYAELDPLARLAHRLDLGARIERIGAGPS